MDEKELKEIEAKANGDDHPGDIWFIETLVALVKEIRRLKNVPPWEKR